MQVRICDPVFACGGFGPGMPRVAGTTIREDAIRSFYETMGETLLIFTFINTVLAGTIAFGVVYNNARIALSERSRELASLRVLGYTRGGNLLHPDR